MARALTAPSCAPPLPLARLACPCSAAMARCAHVCCSFPRAPAVYGLFASQPGLERTSPFFFHSRLQCASSVSLCNLPQTCPTTLAGSAYLCPSGPCIIVVWRCDVVLTPSSCRAGVCVSYSSNASATNNCPTETVCPADTPVRCSYGVVRSERCLHCLHLLRLHSLYRLRLFLGLLFSLSLIHSHRLCARQCVASASECVASNVIVCPAQLPYYCSIGDPAALLVTAHSFPRTQKPSCGRPSLLELSPKQYAAFSVGSCALNLANCPSMTLCPVSEPVRCPDGTCALTSSLCVTPDLVACPAGKLTCPDGR